MFSVNTPAKITWEFTRRCTRECSFCYNCSSPAETASPDTQAKIVDQIITCNPLQVTITGGEPLLEPDRLLPVLEGLKAADIYIQLITNGDLLSAEIFHRIKDYCDLITLPILDATAAEHDKLMGPASFSNILRVLELCSRNVYRNLELNFLAMPENIKSLQPLAELLTEYQAVKYLTIYPMVNSGRGQDLDLGSDDILDSIVIDIIDLKDKYQNIFYIGVTQDIGEIRNLLQDQGFNYQVYIEANGRILANQWIPVAGGSLEQAALEKIWKEKLSLFWFNPPVKTLLKEFQNLNSFGFEHKRFLSPPIDLETLSR